MTPTTNVKKLRQYKIRFFLDCRAYTGFRFKPKYG